MCPTLTTHRPTLASSVWVSGWVETGLHPGCSKGLFLLRRQASLDFALPSLSPAQDTEQRRSLMRLSEWRQNRIKCPRLQCCQRQGQVIQTPSASWADTVPRASPHADSHMAGAFLWTELPGVPTQTATSQAMRARCAFYSAPCGWRLRKHIQLNNT